MKTTGNPFAWIDGKAYLICNFTLDTAIGFPSLQDLLEELLSQYSGSDILLLRKLNPEEIKLLEQYTEDSEAEVWATIVAKAKKRERKEEV